MSSTYKHWLCCPPIVQPEDPRDDGFRLAGGGAVIIMYVPLTGIAQQWVVAAVFLFHNGATVLQGFGNPIQ